MITIAEVGSLEELKKRLDPKLVERALKLANSKTAQKTRTWLSKTARKTYNVKAADISRHSKIVRKKGGNSDLMLFYEGKRLSLMYFDPQEKRGQITTSTKRFKGAPVLVSRKAKRKAKRSGVTVRIRKDRGREAVSGLLKFGGRNKNNSAFMARANGNVQIFVRDSQRRLPLTRLTGPSVPQMVGGRDVIKQAFGFIQKEHSKQFNEHIDKLMKGIIK